jgi:leucyl-tRNA synthetase
LLEDLKDLDWPEAIKEQQRNWIGKSIGAEVDFVVEGDAEKIRVFTTRPDTLFGATYMVLSPEHPLVGKITKSERRLDVNVYVQKSQNKSDLERTDLAKEKTGIFTGGYAINPVNNKRIPIWIADYVLASYGTGAIMSVPAHDERDHEFAQKYGLEIIEVVSSGKTVTKFPYVEDGISISSDFLNGLATPQAKEKITAWLEQKGLGKKSVNYKLRDWLFSRQRYWGEPIPVIHVDGKPKPLPQTDLPLLLPEVKSYEPTGTGESPLAAIKEWVETKDPETKKPAKRETNTMPQWAGSCWYYLRYIDAQNARSLVDLKKEKYWMPVDLYVGGAEHAVLHLLYARFWHKVLFDCDIVSTKEPFQKLVNQGMILGEDNQKMSKSRGNVVNPDELMAGYGADSVRLYEMFLGPLEMVKPWSTKGVEGVYRFLARIWRLFVDQNGTVQSHIQSRSPREEELKRLHRVIKKVTDDLENLKFNTGVSALMIFLNEELLQTDHSREALEKFILILAPFAPHMAEELWEKMKHKKTLAYESWPVYDERYLVETEVEIAIQITGKIRSRMIIPKGLSEGELKERVFSDEIIKKWIDGKKVQKFIVVPDRLVNLII